MISFANRKDDPSASVLAKTKHSDISRQSLLATSQQIRKIDQQAGYADGPPSLRQKFTKDLSVHDVQSVGRISTFRAPQFGQSSRCNIKDEEMETEQESIGEIISSGINRRIVFNNLMSYNKSN